MILFLKKSIKQRPDLGARLVFLPAREKPLIHAHAAASSLEG